jgi:hypothetical protein
MGGFGGMAEDDMIAFDISFAAAEAATFLCHDLILPCLCLGDKPLSNLLLCQLL